MLRDGAGGLQRIAANDGKDSPVEMIEIDGFRHLYYPYGDYRRSMAKFAALRQRVVPIAPGMSIVSPAGSNTAPSAPAPTLFSRALPYLAMACSMTSFCVGTTYAKQLFPHVGPAGAAAYRVGFAAILLFLFFRPWRRPISRSDLFATMRYGATLGLLNLSFYMSLRTIPFGLALAIEFLGPLTVSLLHSRRPMHFAAVALAAAGLALLLPIADTHHALDPVGVGFALLAGLFWGLYIIFGKQTAHIGGGQGVAFGMATAALVVVPVGLHQAGTALLAPALIAIGLVTALLSSAIPYSLEMVAMKRMTANRFGVLLSAEPAVGAIAGAIVLGEMLTMVQCIAIGLIVTASVVAVLATEKRGDGMGRCVEGG